MSQTVSSWCLEVQMTEGSFTRDSLDGVTLSWRLKDFDTAGLWTIKWPLVKFNPLQEEAKIDIQGRSFLFPLQLRTAGIGCKREREGGRFLTQIIHIKNDKVVWKTWHLELKFSTFWRTLLFFRVFVENTRHDGELGYRNWGYILSLCGCSMFQNKQTAAKA